VKFIVLLLFFGLAVLADPVKYSYDDAGRLILADYGNGNTIAYTYDNAGNLLSRVVSSGTPSNNSPQQASKPKASDSKSKRTRSKARAGKTQ
jgi:YD repeat-containing protein